MKLFVGDARERIKEIPDGSVDLICTSPPFLALRKYGNNPEAEMGSEATPAAFIDGLLDLSAEFRRVLTPHGSIAIELGDTYSGSGGAGGDYGPAGLRSGQEGFDGSAARTRSNRPAQYGSDTGPPRKDISNGWPLAKSLALVPEAYAIALAYGINPLSGATSPAGRWRVRNVIVWARPNPPVGALGDKVRPATSYITVACTSAKRWFDLDAVRTPGTEPDRVFRKTKGSSRDDGLGRPADDIEQNPAGAPPLDWWEDDDPTGHATLVLPTQPYPHAHYATWPETLAKRLILMMCPPGGTVLDPFAGSGTTLVVAHGCGRDAIGIELYPKNCDLIKDRCGLFLQDKDVA